MNTNDTTLLFRVNGIAVPQARLALRVNNAVQTNKQTDSPELRKSIRDDLINLEVLSQNARNSRLDMRAEIAQQLILSTQSVLASTFVQNYTKQHPIPEKALTQEYEALKTRVGSKEFKIAHILVATESEANVILANLKKGSKFERIAKEKSSDPGSKEKGGDLGWAIPSNFVQPFSDAVLNMKKGQISAPVQTQYGWHIIKLDDIRELKVPAFIEVKSNIEKRLEQTAIQDLIKSLRANASVAMGSQTTVNGVSIPQARLELQVKTALQAGQADTAELRKTTLDQLINYELISQESLKLGLNKTTEVSQQIEIAKQSVLAQAFVQDDLKSHPIAEATLLQEYENLKNASAGKKEYKVAHILVETEKEAKAIAASVKNATFSKFAKEKSKDPGSKEQGGELGWTNPSQFVQPFGEAIVKLNKGQISAPVQTQYGWHVIKLDDVRDVTIPPFVEVKANLEKRLQQQAIQDAIKSLRANAKID
jgi:peptidyl-prolyl cis-trans isomerase C